MPGANWKFGADAGRYYPAMFNHKRYGDKLMIMTMEELVGFIIRESVMKNVFRPHKGILCFCERIEGELNDKDDVPDDVLIEYLRNFLARSGIVVVDPDNNFYVRLANEIRYHSDDYDGSLIYESVRDYDDANGSKDVPGSFWQGECPYAD